MYNGVIRVNSKAAMAAVISFIVCVYLIYSWSSGSSVKSATHHRRLDTWKKHDFVDIPEGIDDMAPNIKVNQDTIKVVLDGQVTEKKKSITAVNDAEISSQKH